MKRGPVFIVMASIPPKVRRSTPLGLRSAGVGHLARRSRRQMLSFAGVKPRTHKVRIGARRVVAVMAGGEQANSDPTVREDVWKPA